MWVYNYQISDQSAAEALHKFAGRIIFELGLRISFERGLLALNFEGFGPCRLGFVDGKKMYPALVEFAISVTDFDLSADFCLLFFGRLITCLLQVFARISIKHDL